MSASAAAPCVKVCGVTRVEDALLACRSGANFIGVILAPSPRTASSEQARGIVDAVRAFGERTDRPWGRPALQALMPPPGSSPAEWFQGWGRVLQQASRRTPLVVGVFVDAGVAAVRDAVESLGLDLVQLHGEEDVEEYGLAVGAPCIKVVHLPPGTESEGSEGEVVRQIEALRGKAAAILLDTKVKGQAGGTGITFDWKQAAQVGQAGVPCIMAGGLHADNIQQAIQQAMPWGVDASSSLEGSTPGVKDAERLCRFIETCKRAAL